MRRTDKTDVHTHHSHQAPPTQTRFPSRLRNKVAALAAAAVLLPTALAGVSPAMAAPAASSGIEFTDNPVGSNYYDEIVWMAEEGLSHGYADGSFGKGRQVTRGETAAFLYRLADPDFKAPAKSPFPDLKPGETHYEAITWLSAEGHIGGYSDKSFRKDRTITRGETAKMLFNANGVEYTAPKTDAFPDVKVGHSYHQYISWFNETGLSTGYVDGEYKPGRNITRGELAKLLKGTHEEVTEPVAPEQPKPSEPVVTPAPKPTPEPEPTEPTEPVVTPTPAPTPTPEPTPEPTEPVVSPTPEPTPTPEPEPTPEPTEPVVTPEPEPTVPALPARPDWDKTPATMATVPQGISYEAKADYLMDYYGCGDTQVEFRDSFPGGDYITGGTTRPNWVPAFVELRTQLTDSELNATSAHECMHVKQHEASGWDRSVFASMVQGWYQEGLTYETWVGGEKVVKPLPEVEQSAECAIRWFGFQQDRTHYNVDCDARGLHAGLAIANGLDPNEVPFAG